MKFEQILGQHSIKSKLIETVAHNRVSHSQLFYGPEGNGSLLLAIAYSQYLLCESPSATDSCGTCIPCKQVSSFNYPDLHFVYPVAKTQNSSKNPTSIEFLSEWKNVVTNEQYFGVYRWLQELGVENKQALISVHESASVLSKLQLKSYSGRKKIMILWMPERMNIAAANKLLKLLEEPPSETVFLLVGEDPDALLKTINSRCQKVFVPKLSLDITTKFLTDTEGLDTNAALVIARLADGNIALAKNLAERAEIYKDYATLFSTWVRNCYSAKLIHIIEWSEKCGRFHREKLKDYLTFCSNTFRDSINIHFESMEDFNSVFKEINFKLQDFSKFIHEKNTPRILEELDNAAYDIGRNANARVVLTDLSLNVARLLRVKP